MSNDSNDSKSDQDKRFETLQREIAVAAREQGGDADENFRLRYAMRRAEEAQAEEPLTAEAEAEPEAEDDESDDDFACLAEAARGATDADPPSNPKS